MHLPERGKTGMLPPQFDPSDLLHTDDPNLTYAHLRDAGPLLRITPGVWILPRYQEVSTALNDPKLGAFRFEQNSHVFDRNEEQRGAGHDAKAFLDGAVVAANGPDHVRIRAALRQALTRRMTPPLQAKIYETAERIFATALERGGVEVVSDLAHVLPVTVIADLLGIPMGDRLALAHTVLQLSALFSPFISEAEKAAADCAIIQLRRLVSKIFDLRLSRPADDVISDLAVASTKGSLTQEEAIDNTIFLLFAGLETSVTMIAAGCTALATYPEELVRLKEDSRLVATAVEEFLRFDSPTHTTARCVVHPVQIAGRSLSPGRILLLSLGSANRDERHFKNASRLDVGRSPNRHVAFGAGAHYCIGAALARMEGAAVFREIARRFKTFELRSEPIRKASVTARIYLKVEIAVVGA